MPHDRSGPTRMMNRNFFLLWQGQAVSRLGSQAFIVAAMFWLKHATGSATLMGLIMMASMLPSVLLGPFGGSLADRWSQKKIIVTCDVIDGFLVMILAALMWIAPDAHGLIIGWLAFTAAASGMIGSLFTPAIHAAIPVLVPVNRVAAANSLNEGSYQVAALIGQGVGGVLFRVLGAPLLLLIDGITFIYSALSETFISIPRSRSAEREEPATKGVRRLLSETRDGFRYAWGSPGLRILFVSASFLNFFAMPFFVLFPFYVEDVLGARPDWYGYLLAGLAGGGLLGYVFAGTVKLRGRARSNVPLLMLVGMAVLMTALGVTRSTWGALAIAVAVGFVSGAFNIVVMTLIQVTTPESLRGRMFGLLNTLVMGLSPISMGITGVVADLMNQDVALLFVICGAILVVLSLGVSFNSEFRRFLASEPKPNDG